MWRLIRPFYVEKFGLKIHAERRATGVNHQQKKMVEQVSAWRKERDLPLGMSWKLIPTFLLYHGRKRVAMRREIDGIGIMTTPSCNLLSRMWHNHCRLAKKIINIDLIKASLILLLVMLYPICGFADDKADTPQAVESRTVNSDQATEQTAPKNETKKDQTLEPIVVTATRTEKSLSDVPAAVSVVTSQDIESRNIQKVDEAVDLVPGVFDKRSKGLDTTGYVIMRGIPSQVRNLVLLDGEPLNNGYTGIVNWNSLNPEDIARIEVARGPFSSLYGGNAMGGVINILTKTPQEREVTIKSGYGSDNTWY